MSHDKKKMMYLGYETKCQRERETHTHRKDQTLKKKAWEAEAGESEAHNELCFNLVLSGECCDGEKPG